MLSGQRTYWYRDLEPKEVVQQSGHKYTRRALLRWGPDSCFAEDGLYTTKWGLRGEAVPQRVRRHALLDPRGLGGGTDGATELAGRQRLDRVAAGKQPASRQQQAAPPPLAPPGAWRTTPLSMTLSVMPA